MNRKELINYCLSFSDSYEDYPFDGIVDEHSWTAMRHKTNKKCFAFIYERGGKLCINLKCEPLEADFLRRSFAGVIPAYHMNKTHWNTVFLDSDVSKNELFEQIVNSYDLTNAHPCRCPWANASAATSSSSNILMRDYHDKQWGKPCHDERELFEMLTLEGAQAGLSWSTILNKRENYRLAFDDWDISKIAAYNDFKIAELLQNPGIIRNRLKINSVITNAQVTLRLGSLDKFLWSYVQGNPIVNHWENQEDVPVSSPLSERISKDMKKIGFKFVGSTIIYSYLQATGVINDHITCCEFRFSNL